MPKHLRAGSVLEMEVPTPLRAAFLVPRCQAVPRTVLAAAGHCCLLGLQLLSIPTAPWSCPCADPTALPGRRSWLRPGV